MPQIKITYPSYSEIINLEDTKQLTIGRYDINSVTQCDILLDFKHVSRRHCTIILMFKDKQFYWIIKDGVLSLKEEKIQSANGTFINGKLITQITKLNNGDEITFSANHYYPSILFISEPTESNLESEKDTLEHDYLE